MVCKYTKNLFRNQSKKFLKIIILDGSMRKMTHEEISKLRYTPEILSKMIRFPIYGLLDNIRSLYNVGAIFRIADGARIEKLFLSGYTPHPPRKEIEKTALGATTTVPWEYHKNPVEIIHGLKSQNIKICVLEHVIPSKPYYSLTNRDFPLCVVLGNEITGISHEIIEAADMGIEIPMHGMKQSLNAAVAFGIAVFEIVRIYNEKRLFKPRQEPHVRAGEPFQQHKVFE